MNVNSSPNPNRVREEKISEKFLEGHRPISSSKNLVKLAAAPNNFNVDDKIKEIFQSEFHSLIENILTEEKEEFIKILSEKVKRSLNENPQQDENIKSIINTVELNEILTEIQIIFKNEVYLPTYEFLKDALENYEAKLQNSSHRKNSLPVSKTIDMTSYLKKFKKHCSKTIKAIHPCGDKLMEIFSENTKDQPKYLLCIKCKKVYTLSSILLYCDECEAEYHTCYIKSDNPQDIEIQPATWDKYHCDAIVNDQMKCIKCKETFYLNCLTGNLQCKNENCKITVNPSTLGWKCIFCKEEFSCGAKVYNPLEFKNIKSCIKEALFKMIPARPQIRPCCGNNNHMTDSENKSNKVWLNSNEYFNHKKDCSGNLYIGYLYKKQIVVCEKCKSMNFYEKFIWTCPVCLKRFRQKPSSSNMKSQSNNRTPIRVSHSNYNSNCNSSSNLNSKFNSNPNSNLKTQERGSSKEPNLKRPPRFDLRAGSNFNLTGDKQKEISPKYRNEPKSGKEVSQYSNSLKKENDQAKDPQYNEVKKCLMNEFKSEEQETSNKVNITNINLINIINLNNNMDNKNLLDRLKATPDLRDITRKLSFSKAHAPVSDIHKLKTAYSNENFDGEKNRMSTPNMKKRSSGTITIKQQDINYNQNNFNLNLDDFEIIKQIGEGSFGVIYCVQHKYTSEKYAMKKIIAHSEKEVNMFKQEYELMNTITDDPKNKYCRKHVLKIYGTDVKKLDSTTFALYVFSELANTDWEQEINQRYKIRKFYTEEELIEILKNTVKTLSEMQRENISHRDIKPQNVLIFNKVGTVYKIADFGEAKELKLSKQQLNTLRGTELYMSPILFFSLRNKTSSSFKINHNPFKSDLFSLGLCMLLAATLTFRSLCEIRELQDTKSIILVVNKYLRGKYSSNFIQAIMAMLEFSESQRYDFIQMEEVISKI